MLIFSFIGHILQQLLEKTRQIDKQASLTFYASKDVCIIKKRVKVGLSPSKKVSLICFNESPLKMINNVFISS